MRVMMWSHWHPNSNGTDYWEALGLYDDLGKEAQEDAHQVANDRYEWPSEEEQEESGIETEGPDVMLEEYDPEKHDMLKAGGGSFADEFERLEGTSLAGTDPYSPNW